MSLTYSEYLQLNKVLDAQAPISKTEHDEMLFIVIHQTYELWFKQILHECQFLQTRLAQGNREGSLQTLHRILVILKTLVSQADILETMTPISFLGFRHRLQQASGFQSLQFRILEGYLGNKSAKTLDFFAHLDPERHLEKAYTAPTLYDSLLQYLATYAQVPIPAQVLQRNYTEPYTPHSDVQQAILTLYRTRPDLLLLLERYVDLDEGLQEWRYRHVKMVERTIGTQPGTGGSSGVAYLRSTLFRPAFEDLWIIRSDM